MGVQNYLPDMPLSEDAGSIEKHIQLMKEEKKKKYPDIKRVDTAMQMTLSSRQRMIVEENATVVEIQEIYPWLFEESQVG